MPSTPSFTRLDKALVVVAGLASKSAKLSTAEKRELKALAVKGAKRGRQGFTVADRARCAWLIRKAGPESLPDVQMPPWLRRLLHWPDKAKDTPPPPPLREPESADPLSRLEKLGRLRGTVLSESQFEVQRSKILADPTIGGFGAADGTDPLDRLTKVGELESSGVITAEQAALVTEQVLDGS